MSKKDEYFGEFDAKMKRHTDIANRELDEKLNIGVAAAEAKLGLEHQPTSEHAERVYSSSDPETTKGLARSTVDWSAEMAREHTRDGILLDHPKEQELVDLAFEEPAAAAAVKGKHTARVVLEEQNPGKKEQPVLSLERSGEHGVEVMDSSGRTTRHNSTRGFIDRLRQGDQGRSI